MQEADTLTASGTSSGGEGLHHAPGQEARNLKHDFLNKNTLQLVWCLLKGKEEGNLVESLSRKESHIDLYALGP